MKLASSHYSIALEPADLAVWALKKADALSTFRQTHPNIILCYSGMSGVAHATALALAYAQRYSLANPLGMAYARKKEEISHGFKVERAISQDMLTNGQPLTMVFVDDFIASGSTFTYTKEAVKGYLCGQCGLSLDWDSTVGAILSDEDGTTTGSVMRNGITLI